MFCSFEQFLGRVFITLKNTFFLNEYFKNSVQEILCIYYILLCLAKEINVFGSMLYLRNSLFLSKYHYNNKRYFTADKCVMRVVYFKFDFLKSYLTNNN